MARIANDRSETAFCDYKPALDRDQATIEANRCLFCADAPCIKACPTGIDIPQFIRKIATENVKGSARTIFDANILGMSCARVCPVEVLCVGACVYNEMGVPPIQIGKLQRYATDAAFEQGWRFFGAGTPTGKKVALVGSGPASLACAHELRRFGHACTIFDGRNEVGGLNTTGVAPYKMRADRSEAEVEWILGIGGIELRPGVAIGKDVAWTDLERDYDAVFIGVGLGADSRLSVPGEDLAGIEGAVAWIERMKLGHIAQGAIRCAVVVGGGNTAIDAVRELIGLGVPSVTLCYRGTEDKMSGYAHEWEAARTAGAQVAWQTLPVAFVGDGHVQWARCTKVDASKRPIDGSEHDLAADLVLLAIGQAKLGEFVGDLTGVRVDRGRIVVDARQATGRAGVFAGGDCANGGKEVVNAAAEGKLAARSIHAHLMGGA